MCCIYIEKRRGNVRIGESHLSQILATFDWLKKFVDENIDTYEACNGEKKKSSIWI